MAQWFKLFLVPGSVQFLAIGVALGAGLLWGGARLQRWGRLWLTVLLPGYLLLSTPFGADVVSAPLAWRYEPLRSAAQVPGVDTVVALSTGSWVYRAGELEVDEMGRFTAFNAMEAARLYALLGSPTVVVTGGIVVEGSQRRPESEVMADGLVRLGIPRERIVLETRSRNTREQAANAAALLRQRGTKRVVLVTNSEHMRRALAVFRAEGLEPVPSPSRVGAWTPPGLFNRLRPSVGAFQLSERACYEYFALAYYWGRDVLGLDTP